MTTNTLTADVIRDYIRQQFPLARQKEIRDDDSLLEEGLIDSLGVLEVVAFLESQFNILLSDEEMLSDNFETISTLSAFVDSKTSCNATSSEET